MPTSIGLTPKLNGIDSANIRDSLKPIDDAIVAFADANEAFVVVNGTYDVDWTALAAAGRPGTNTPYANMGRTLRFDDALQATAPLYIRLMFGHASTNTPGLFVQLGTDVNPVTGELAGQLSTVKMMNYGVAVTANFPVWISGDKNYLSLQVRGISGNATASSQLIIERMRDEAGLETNEGAIMLWGSNVSVGTPGRGRVQSFPFAGTVPAEALAEAHIPPLSGMSGVPTSGTDIVLVPIMVPHNGKWRYAKTFAYRHADITEGSIFELDHLGDEHTFVALGANLGGQVWQLPQSTLGLATRWE